MELNELLSVEQCQSEIKKLETRNESLLNEIQTRSNEFENENIEKRDETLAQVEQMKNELETNKSLITKINERMNLLEKEKKMELKTKVETPCERQNMNEIEYRDKWIAYVKGDIEESELRAVTSSATGVPVPTQMQAFVETAWENVGKISNLVTKTYVKGILAVPYEVEADDAQYHVEGAPAPTEENLTLGQTLLQPVMIKKWISVTDEVKALTGDEFLRYISDELVYKVVKFLDDQIVAGTGSSKKGVIGITASALVDSLQADLDFNVVNTALASLENLRNEPVVIMNRKTYYSNFMGLKDTTGQPIFRVINDNGKVSNLANGIPVIFTSALKDYDTATTEPYLIVGDLSAYKLNLPEGGDVKVLHDPYTLATEDKERIIGRLFVAGDIVRPHALVKVTKKASAK